MISTISEHPTLRAEFLGTAPASPQSARGESAAPSGVRTERLAASQANSPLYDQRAQLTDQSVAARTQAGETAARSGMLEADPAATNAAAAHLEELDKDRAPETPRTVEAGQEAASRNAPRGNTGRALAAYGASASDDHAPGQLLEAAV